MVGLNEIKIKEGKITTLIGERCCGMTTLLCTFIKKALDNNGKVLVISDKARSAKELFDKLNDYKVQKYQVCHTQLNHT